MIELLTHKLSFRNNELRIFSDEKDYSVCLSQDLTENEEGCIKEEVSESQKEGVEGEKQRQEMDACRSKAVSQ